VRALGFALAAIVSTPVADAGLLRMPLHVSGEVAPAGRPRSLKIGRETRPLFAESGRRLLSVAPAEVEPGGEVFIFGKVPADSQGADIVAEALVWELPRAGQESASPHPGGWRRLGLIPHKAATGGHVSLVTVDPALPTGPVVTGVFLRAPTLPGERVVDSLPVEVPKNARLRFAYGIDELDTTGLAPVLVSVTALVTAKRSSEVERVTLFEREVTPSGVPAAWWEGSVDLDDFSGRTVAFELKSRAHPTAPGLRPHVAWSAPAILHEVRGKAPTSLVLVSLGNVRAQSLGSYGAPPDRTPFLDNLFGSDGVIFDRAITGAVETIAAHVSLLTGTPACTHGVRTASDRLDPTWVTLAEQLGSAGYTTAAFTDGGGMVPEVGLGRGFDVYVELAGARGGTAGGGPVSPFATAIEWLAQREEEPTFLFVHTSAASFSRGSDVDSVRAAYEASVRALDGEMRKFVVEADRLVDPDRSILVVTSAHGDELAEHGVIGHGTQLFDESIWIPLMIRGPALKGGMRIGGSIGQIDIAPTLLQLCGLESPPGVVGRGLGDSLLSASPIESATRFVEAKAPLRETVSGPAPGWSPPAYAVVDGERKLIRDVVRGVERAFDVGMDASESHDLLAGGVAPAEVPEWVVPLRAALGAHITSCKSAPVQARSADEYLTPDSRMRLRALGYRD
jgi:hypothetical protein